MAKRFTNDIERAVFAISALTDRAKLATLKGDRPENTRLCKVMYHLRKADDAGMAPEQTLEEALRKSYADAPVHRSLVRDQILRCYTRLRHFKCFDSTVIDGMRRGRSPYIQKGPFKGEQLWVEHIVPKARAPELARNFANLGFNRKTVNHAKSDRITPKEIAFAARLTGAGLFPPEKLTELARPVTASSPSKYSQGVGRPNSVSSGAGTDPRVLIPRVQTLSEQIEDWERRAGASLDQAEYVQLHAVEQVNRMVTQLAAAQNRLGDDQSSTENLRREIERCKERCAEIELRANQAHDEASKATIAATRARDHWHRELASARNWLQAARRREAQAEYERNQAVAELHGAIADLRHAEAELESARHRTEYAGRDKDGRAMYRSIDTTPYRQAVDSAAYVVRQREHDLAVAEAELSAAIADRKNAEERVAACERAVSLCEDAVRETEAAMEAASRAHSASERAFEEQKRAAKCHEFAAARLSMQENEVSSAQAAHREAGNGENAAQLALKHAGETLADARQRSTRGRSEIEWRLEKLREFDAPMHGF